MGRPRTDLQAILQNIIGKGRIYFQPPSTVRMTYPCIVYERSRIDSDHADNNIYKTDNQYTVTVIYTDPESDLPFKVANIPTARHSTHFITDNLYHDVFTIYF